MAQMADTRKPTAANIISSLGVKGAISGIPSGADPSAYASFVPVLDENGKLSVDFIPSSAVEKVVKPISNVAVVDPNTEVEEANRSGSTVAPFKSLHEAASKVGFDSAGRCVVLLMPGKYSGNDNAYMDFRGLGKFVAIVGIGTCEISSGEFNVYGVSGGQVFLQNITTNNNVQVYYSSGVACLGRTYIGGTLNVGQITLKLSSEARVASTDASAVQYLSDSAHISNTSKVVKDGTVEDALNRLHARKIRISKIEYGYSGFDVGSSSCIDISADSSESGDVYDLRTIERILVSGINDVIAKGKNPVVGTLTANKVIADSIETMTLKMDALMLGGYKLSIDTQGYLVVIDGDATIIPPEGVILIEDTGSSSPGAVYAISVKNGRLKFDSANDDSDSPSSVVTEFMVVDSVSGDEYVITAEDGRLVLSSANDSGSSVTYTSKLYVMDESTGISYKVVAFKDPQTGEVNLGAARNGIGPRSPRLVEA